MFCVSEIYLLAQFCVKYSYDKINEQIEWNKWIICYYTFYEHQVKECLVYNRSVDFLLCFAYQLFAVFSISDCGH